MEQVSMRNTQLVKKEEGQGTYSRCNSVVFVLSASAMASAPSAPMLLVLRLCVRTGMRAHEEAQPKEGKKKKKQKNILECRQRLVAFERLGNGLRSLIADAVVGEAVRSREKS